MPVAGAIKMDISADATDRASVVLRAVQSEMKKTEDRLRQLSAVSKEDTDISDILARGSGKARRELAAEVDAQEKAAQKRREMVQASREAAAASDNEGRSLQGLKSKIEGAARAKEFLNKTLGLAGFVGIAVGAVAAIGDLVDSLDPYKQRLQELKDDQENFNRRLQEMADSVRLRDLEKMGELERNIAEARQKLNEEQDRNVGLQKDVEARTRVVAELEAKRAEVLDKIAHNMGINLVPLLLEQRKIEDELKTRVHERDEAQDLLTKHAGQTAERVKETTREYQQQLLLVKDVAAEHERFVKDIYDFKKAEEKKSLDMMKSAADAADKPRARGGGGGGREREESLRRELELALAGTEADRLRIQREHILADVAAKKMSAAEGELRLKLQQLRVEEEIAKFNADVAVGNQKAAEDAKRDAQKALEEAEQRREKARDASEKKRQEALEDRAKAIERIGSAAQLADAPLTALSGRLAAVSDAVAQSSRLWAEYKRGQETLGGAIAGTIGFLGQAAAQAISDKKARAAVEGAFESAASIASFAGGDIPGGIGHAAAAAAFFGVAATGGAGASSGAASAGAGGAGRAQPSNVIEGNFGQRSSRPEPTTQLIIIQSRDGGIIYGTGSEVAKFASSTARSLRGTNMDRAGVH